MNISNAISDGFLASSSTSFLQIFNCLFGRELLSSPALLSLEDLLWLSGLFLFGCSFRGSPTLYQTSLLLGPWTLDLIIKGPSPIWCWPCILKLKKLGLNYTVIFMRDTVIVVFNPLSANPTKWLNTLEQFVGKLPVPAWHRLGSKNAVFDHLRFYEIKSEYCFLSNLHFFYIRTGSRVFQALATTPYSTRLM